LTCMAVMRHVVSGGSIIVATPAAAAAHLWHSRTTWKSVTRRLSHRFDRLNCTDLHSAQRLGLRLLKRSLDVFKCGAAPALEHASQISCRCGEAPRIGSSCDPPHGAFAPANDFESTPRFPCAKRGITDGWERWVVGLAGGSSDISRCGKGKSSALLTARDVLTRVASVALLRERHLLPLQPTLHQDRRVGPSSLPPRPSCRLSQHRHHSEL